MLNSRADPLPFFPRHEGGGSFDNIQIVGPLVEYDFLTSHDDVRTTFGCAFEYLKGNM